MSYIYIASYSIQQDVWQSLSYTALLYTYTEIIGSTEDRSIISVLNYIASSSYQWYDIGEALGLSKNELDGIKEYPRPDRIAHLVELWYRLDADFSLVKLQQALRSRLLIEVPRFKRRTPSSTTVEKSADVIKKEIDGLQDEFYSLIIGTKKQLDYDKKAIADVHDTLVFLPDDLKDIYSPLLDKRYHILQKCDSHGNFFSKLNECWNFIDFDLLKRIIEKHGDARLNSAMKRYLDDLRKFRESTTVYQLIKIWKPKCRPSDISDESREFVMSLKQDPKTCTIEMLDDLRNDTCTAIRLSKTAMILFIITDGSVKVVWLVAEKHVDLFSALIKTKYSVSIENYGIEFLSLDGYILYPVNEVS